MELRVIEKLLEKYFNATASIAEERALKEYFSSPGVAPHLEQYRPLFQYFDREAGQTFEKSIPLKRKKRPVAWLSAAAGFVLLSGLFTIYNREPEYAGDLGTYNDPDIAFQETQKALNMLSDKVNVGISGVAYLGEYENSKNKIFKDDKK